MISPKWFQILLWYDVNTAFTEVWCSLIWLDKKHALLWLHRLPCTCLGLAPCDRSGRIVWIECENFCPLEATLCQLKSRNEWSYLHIWIEEWNLRLSRLWKQLETQNRRSFIDWSRSVKQRRQVCTCCLRRAWLRWVRWEKNCWPFTCGIQQICSLFYRERWWNFLQSDWKKEAL